MAAIGFALLLLPLCGGQFVLPLDETLASLDSNGAACPWGSWSACACNDHRPQQRRQRVETKESQDPCRAMSLHEFTGKSQVRSCKCGGGGGSYLSPLPWRGAMGNVGGGEDEMGGSELNPKAVGVGMMFFSPGGGGKEAVARVKGKRDAVARVRAAARARNHDPADDGEGLVSRWLIRTHIPLMREALGVLFEAGLVVAILCAAGIKGVLVVSDMRRQQRRWERRMRAKLNGDSSTDGSSDEDENEGNLFRGLWLFGRRPTIRVPFEGLELDDMPGNSSSSGRVRKRVKTAVPSPLIAFLGFELEKDEALDAGAGDVEASSLMASVQEEEDAPELHWSVSTSFRNERSREFRGMPAV